MVAAAGYTVREVARLLRVSPARVRQYVQDGLIEAARGSRHEYRFTFQDLVLLRAARQLVDAGIPRRRIRRALAELKRALPGGHSPAEVQIGVENGAVVVDDGTKRWCPESGQLHFDFADDGGADDEELAPVVRVTPADEGLTADEWYDWGCERETEAPEEARAAYLRVLRLEPDHSGALVNLGRLLHEAGEPDAAERHYRRALKTSPDDATAAYNLGVALEDQGKQPEALAAYEIALRADPDYADAHYNAAGLCERLGRRAEAVAHFNAYRKLVGTS
jgi:tetratricopeptide (TPR) repeat protein